MTTEKQAEIISAACEKHGLDGHIKWINKKQEAYTIAEKIAIRFRAEFALPVKNSYMYCDALDMCFFFLAGEPAVSYAGYATVTSKDISREKLENAFRTAGKVLESMKELCLESEAGK